MAGTVKVTKEMMEAAQRETDWAAQDALTDEEIASRVAGDPDAAPVMTAEQIQAARARAAALVPDVKATRARLGLTQAAFAARFHLPVSSIRDWEQHRTTPDPAARVLLRVIDHNPKAVERALAGVRKAG